MTAEYRVSDVFDRLSEIISASVGPWEQDDITVGRLHGVLETFAIARYEAGYAVGRVDGRYEVADSLASGMGSVAEQAESITRGAAS